MSASRPFSSAWSPAFGPFAGDGPCASWPVLWACDPPSDAEVASAALAAAQGVLWARLGRRHGPCTATEAVPVRRTSVCCARWVPALIDGAWFNVAACDNGCAGDACCWLPLPRTPVVAVTAVTVNGTDLDPSTWRLYADRLFLNHGCWPRADECDPSPVTVTWTYGLNPPAGIDLAMGELACEFAKGWQTGACRLPSRLVAITRQGVSMDLGTDLALLLDKGLTGLPICDALIAAHNPAALPQASGVYSPDFPGVR